MENKVCKKEPGEFHTLRRNVFMPLFELMLALFFVFLQCERPAYITSYLHVIQIYPNFFHISSLFHIADFFP